MSSLITTSLASLTIVLILGCHICRVDSHTILNMIQQEVKAVMNTEEGDAEPPNSIASGEPQVPPQPKASRKISIFAIGESHETKPEFFAFTMKFQLFLFNMYHLSDLEVSEVNWVSPFLFALI